MGTDLANPLTRNAYAKVNLALAVAPLDQQAGMHEICSWMHSVSLADEVSLARADAGSLYSIRWADGQPVQWAIEDDLAARAHRAVQAYTGKTLAVELAICKRIPAGGGLGGGSSDAAVVILMLDELFNLGLSLQGMRTIASSLGSDVSFFVDPESYKDRLPPRAALVSGIGDTIERVGRESMPITLVAPPFGCATAEVYRAFDENGSGGFDPGAVRGLVDEQLGEDSALFNDLAEAAMVVSPELRTIREGLSVGLGRAVHVSGSGSNLFVLGEVDDDEIRRLRPSCGVIRSALV